ncbi:MAG TPA: methenyltetrahydromethanopterin cyclohydrolase [Ilumatobacteraceae bacterium]|nr:methenyltetrahydromethanopterin cyclohydrolase [Ilumatobacteraceae bacterium]HRB01817.1 methenyltetrahydromethanopterin cyclohydrolase [Ilumatobacteraceae bacterium]
MISINAEAMKIVRQVLADADSLGVIVHRLDNGSTLIDMGLEAKAGWRAAKAYTQITLSGLAEVSFEPFPLGDRMLTAVRVMIDHPIEACVASQIAGWRQEASGTEHAAILAGPGRALNHGDLDHYFDLIDYRDHHDEAVVAIQASQPVSAAMAQRIADGAGVAPESLYILVAPNHSLVCAVQVAARIVEQSLHRLAEEGFDLRCVRYAHGFGVVPPLVDDDLISMGRINDSLLYGGVSTVYVDSTDDVVQAVVPKVVSSASRAYGRPFVEIYEDAGRDFYDIPLDLHSPAVLHINNIASGRTFSAGELNMAVLEKSFFG